MSTEHIEVVNDVEVVEVDVIASLWKLMRAGQVTMSADSCTSETTATVVLKDGGSIGATSAGLVYSREKFVSPIAMCLLDLTRQLKELRSRKP